MNSTAVSVGVIAVYSTVRDYRIGKIRAVDPTAGCIGTSTSTCGISVDITVADGGARIINVNSASTASSDLAIIEDA